MRLPWWARPSILAVLAVVPGLLILQVMSADRMATLWKVPKLATGTTLGLSLLALLLLVAGCEAALARTRFPAGTADSPDVPEWQVDLARRAGWVLAALALLGYALWSVIAVSRGATLVAVRTLVSAESTDSAVSLREQLAPVGGATTAVQFAIPAVALLTASAVLAGRRIPAVVWLLWGLAAFRALVNSERLAFVEVLVPTLVVWFALRGHRRWRRPVAWAPVLGPAALLVFFGGFEYFRSWAYYRSIYPGGFADFVFFRVAGYYVTAANNNALFWTQFRGELPAPYFSWPALWEAPGISTFSSYEQWYGVVPFDAWRAQLAVANPEFNNWGSMLVWFAELGVVAGCALWALVGWLTGRLYRAARLGSLPALVTFGCATTWLLELGRTPGFLSGRSVPVLLGLLGFWLVLRLRADQREAARVLRRDRRVSFPRPAGPVGPSSAS